MRFFPLLLFAAAGLAHADRVGYIAVDGGAVHIYDTPGSCTAAKEFMAGKTPGGDTFSPYVAGCWRSMQDGRIVVTFNDGTWLILKRSDMVPVGKRRFSL